MVKEARVKGPGPVESVIVKPRRSKRKSAAAEVKPKTPPLRRSASRKKKAASADEAGQKQQQAGTPRKRSKNSTQVAESPVSSEKATPEDAKVDAAAQLREAFDEAPKPAQTLKVVTWNVNGLRALLKKRDSWAEYLKAEDPDILCLNETKVGDADVGKLGDIFPGLPHGQWHCSTAKKGYSGVAIFSKVPPDSVVAGFHSKVDAPADREGRVLTARFKGMFTVVAAYVPNSGLKLDRLGYRTNGAKSWDAYMQAHLAAVTAEHPDEPVMWCGDLNVAHRDMDLAESEKKRNKMPGFCDAERVNFGKVVGGEGEVWRSGLGREIVL